MFDLKSSVFSWNNRNVFITGAAGFIGGWLADELAREGACTTALVRSSDASGPWLRLLDSHGISVVKADVQDADSIERILRHANIDTVFHLAAINVNVGTAISPVAIFESNIRGTWNVLEACRLVPSVERIVVASSREAEEPETDPRRRHKRHPYQVSKMSAELVTQSYADTYNLPVVISRSDNIYGGRDVNWNRLIPGTLRLLLNGSAPELRSDGTLKRDYVYVTDMVNAYLRLGAHAADAGIRGETFSFATGVSTSALAIVTQLCELVGRPDLKPSVIGGPTIERVNQESSPTREFDALGWTSRVDVRTGLQATVDWYRTYFADSREQP